MTMNFYFVCKNYVLYTKPIKVFLCKWFQDVIDLDSYIIIVTINFNLNRKTKRFFSYNYIHSNKLAIYMYLSQVIIEYFSDKTIKQS